MGNREGFCSFSALSFSGKESALFMSAPLLLVALLVSETLCKVPLVFPTRSVARFPIFCLLKGGSEAFLELAGALGVGLKVCRGHERGVC